MIRKSWIILICLMIIGTGFFLPPKASAETAGPNFQGGTGTADDPYLIDTPQQLQAFASRVNSGAQNNSLPGNPRYAEQYYRLTADVDLSAYPTWIPIGMLEPYAFQGHFDGDGHTISHLNISNFFFNGVVYGLFGYVRGGTIVNLGLTNVYLNFDDYTEVIAGGLAGTISGDSHITNTFVSGSVIMGWESIAGGLIGKVTGTLSIDNSYFSGDQNELDASLSGSGSNRIGGLIGEIYTGTVTIRNAYAEVSDVNHALIECKWVGFMCGGLVGHSFHSALSIENAHATGDVVSRDYWSEGNYLGGLVGNSEYSQNPIKIIHSFFNGSIGYFPTVPMQDYDSITTIGGIIGGSESIMQITDSYYLDQLLPQAGTLAGSGKEASFFTSIAKDSPPFNSWDFYNVWRVVNGKLKLLRLNGMTIASERNSVGMGNSIIISGVVYNAEHQPVPGAMVSLNSSRGAWSTSGSVNAMATTDENGHYAVTWTAPEIDESTQGISVQFAATIANHVPNIFQQTYVSVYYVPKWDAPTANPSGGKVAKGTKVALTAPLGTGIYYTTDGSVPTRSSTFYHSPIDVDRPLTIKAIAVSSFLQDSDVMTEQYTIQAPPAPANLRSIPFDRTVYLTWDSSAEADSYTIYRYIGAHAPTDWDESDVIQTGWNTNWYMAGGLTNGTAYTFAVKAVNDGGESDYSLALTATPQDPSTPTYAIDGISDQTLAPLTTGYASGTQETRSVAVTRSGTGDLAHLGVSLNDNAHFEITPFETTTLNTETPSAYFTVKAKDGLAAGTYTATVTISADNMTSVTFTVTQVVKERAPQNLMATEGDRKVSLNWDAVAGAVTYSVYKFEGTAAPADPAGWVLVQVNISATTYSVTGLRNGTAYTFAVKAVSTGGESDFSAATVAVPKTQGFDQNRGKGGYQRGLYDDSAQQPTAFNWTRQSAYPGIRTPIQQWQFNTGSKIVSSPAIAADGTIYIGSNDYRLYAVRPDGTTKWFVNTEDWVESSPVIAADGTIYVGSDDGKLYAIAPDGMQKWVTATGAPLVSSPAIAEDGTIYIGGTNGDFYAINRQDGQIIWSFSTGDAIFSSPAIAEDGTIYVGSTDGKLYAIKPNGEKKWEFTTQGAIIGNPVIGADGTVYVGCDVCKSFFAIKPDGELNWKYSSPDSGFAFFASPAIASDGTLYVGSFSNTPSKNKLYAFDPAGQIIWEYATNNFPVISTPIIALDGTIYVGSNSGNLYAFNQNGALKWTFPTETKISSSPAIAKDGTIFIGGNNGKLYAISEKEMVAKPAADPVGGAVASGTQVTLSTETAGATIYYTTNGDMPTSGSTLYTGPIEITSAMTIKAIAVKAGMTDSEVMTEQYTILPPEQVAKPVADPVGGAVASGTQVTLSTATAGATIYYTTNGDTPTSGSTLYTGPIEVTSAMTIKAIAVKAGMTDSEVMTEQYTILPPEQVAKPTASLAGRAVLSGTQVTLSTATAGATIYYTTNGDTPTSGSTLYTGPIEITSAMTIKAIAVKAGMTDSEVMTEQYTVLPPEQVAKPVADPVGGAVAPGTQVTLSTATAGATIYYTTNGDTPTSGSILYTGPIEVTSAMTIKAIAVKAGMTDSEVMTEQYTILMPEQVARPVANPVGGAVAPGTQVTLSTATAGATIYYTTNGDMPTSGSTLYTGPLEITSAMTIKAIAVKAGMTDSEVMTEQYTVLPPEQVAKPVADPVGGAVASGTQVTLSTATAGATIYYTTNGDTPTSGSTLYTGPIEVTSAMTIKAIAVKAGMTDSEMMTEQYTVLPPEQVAKPVADPVGGAVASGTQVTLSMATAGATIYYTTNGDTPTSGSTLYTGPIEVTSAMTIKAIAVKAGMTDSEMMTEQYTVLPPEQVAKPVADPVGGAVASGTQVTLSTATAGATIYYTTNGDTPTSGSTLYTGSIEVTSAMTIKAIAVKAGMTDSEMMTEQYTVLPPEQVAKPVADPVGGAVASGTQVTLSTATAGATIYYTTNGDTPTSGSTLYTGPIEVTSAMTIKAIAVKAGMTDSEVMTEQYTILPPEQVAKPTASLAGRAVLSGTQVTLSTATAGATIYYTTNGDMPTSGSTLYTGPLEITSAMTIKAIAVKAGMTDSEVMTEQYTILMPEQVAKPTASLAGGAVLSGTQVTLSTATAGATIYYTTNGDTPTSGSTLYTGPIEVTSAMTIKAIAVKAGMTDSEMMTEQYTVLPPEQVAKPVADPVGGAVASGTQVTLSMATVGATIYYTTNGDTPTSGSTLYTGPIEVTSAMTIKAIAVKAGMTDSEMMTEQYTVLPPEQVAKPVADPVGGAVASGTQVTLSTATAGATIYYTTNGDTPTSGSTLYTGSIEVTSAMTIKAIAVKAGMTDSEMMTEQYTVLPPEQVAKPVADPVGGAVASGTQVTLSTATAGATIYYTTNGDTPTSGSTLYTGPIEVTSAMTIKAIAVKAGMTDSEVMTEQYTILPPEQVAKPTASLAGRAVLSGTQVTLSTATAGATIYYTTNGDMPTSGSTLYTGPIEVTSAMTIKAIAVKAGMTDSEVMTEQYTILPPAQVAKPAADPVGGAVASGTQVTLSTATVGAAVYYTTNGDTPTSGSTLYTGSIEVTSAMTIKAIAVKAGMTDSEVMTEQYTILPPAQVAKPTASLAGGAVLSGTQVTLSTATVGAAVYYTTNGDTPTSGSTLYTGPIEVTSAMTIKAIAVKAGMTDSEVMTEQYTIAVLAVPTNLTATAGDGFVILNWNAVTGTGNVTYTVYTAAPSNPNEWVPVETNVTVAKYTVTGLTNGTNYMFTVKAFVAGNVSDFSNVATATPRASGGGGGVGGNSKHVTSTNGTITIPVGSSGEVSLSGEIVIQVAVGAAEQELRITTEKLLDTSSLMKDRETLFSQVYEVLKNFSGNFKKPVTLSIKFDPTKVGKNQKAAIYYYDEKKKTWIEIGGTVEGEWITTEVDHFTKFAVLAVDVKKDDGGETPQQPEPSFTDIASHWSESFIIRAAVQKLVSGYPDGTFKPNNPVTRAEFTVMLMGALKLDGTGAALHFKDQAKIGAWAKQAVALAVQAGIVNGYEDGSFRPDALITRAEMASMIARAKGLTFDTNARTGFADDKDIPNWANGAVEAIRKLGIVSGRGGNKFVPNDTATRAEAVVMLLRMLEVREQQ